MFQADYPHRFAIPAAGSPPHPDLVSAPNEPDGSTLGDEAQRCLIPSEPEGPALAFRVLDTLDRGRITKRLADTTHLIENQTRVLSKGDLPAMQPPLSVGDPGEVGSFPSEVRRDLTPGPSPDLQSSTTWLNIAG